MTSLAQTRIKEALELCNKEDFRFVPCEFGGDACTLVCPVGFPKWTQKTKYLRSLIYRNSDYLPISVGFPKFVNLGENPEHFPPPKSLDGWSVLEKLDGSLLIVSKHKGQLIFRTRGSTDVERCSNKDEIDVFKKEYENIIHPSPVWPYSLLFEWCSRSQKIVLDYGEKPKLFLIGMIYHDSLNIAHPNFIKEIGEYYKIETPKQYPINDKNLDLLISDVRIWKNKEGVVLYRGQEMFKSKSEDYLVKHRFKSNLNFESLLDLFITLGKPVDPKVVFDYIEKNHDFECATSASGLVEEICEIYVFFLEQLWDIKVLIDSLKANKTISRAEVAKAIKNKYSNLEVSLCFQIYDGKEFTDAFVKKFINYYYDEIPF